MTNELGIYCILNAINISCKEDYGEEYFNNMKIIVNREEKIKEIFDFIKI